MISNSVTLGTLNCQSICNKTDEVLRHIMNTDVDLCFLQETFMSENHTAILGEVKKLGFKILSVPRNKGAHGGLGLVYKPHINIKMVRNSQSMIKFKTIEYAEFTMKSNQGLIFFEHPEPLKQSRLKSKERKILLLISY